nr:cytochrome c oxidase subunit II [Rhabdopleura sp. NHMO H2136]
MGFSLFVGFYMAGLVFLFLGYFNEGLFGALDDLSFGFVGSYYVLRLHSLHSHLMGMMVMVVVVVSFWICSGIFSGRRLGSFKDSGKVEVMVTSLPVLVLSTMMAPSMLHLYVSSESICRSTLNYNIMGRMWYWQYFYPGWSSPFSYDSYLLKGSNRPGMEVDHPLFISAGFRSKFLVSSSDVIHSFSVPALGVKIDAVPGRMNGIDVQVSLVGKYFGFCSELCGSGHSQMPCVVSVICPANKDFPSFSITQSSKVD